MVFGYLGIARQGIYPAIVYVEIDVLEDNLGNKGIIVLWISLRARWSNWTGVS